MFEELSQHILDIAMNSLSADAKQIEIGVVESRRHDRLVLRVRDDGHGMDADTLRRVLATSASTKRSRRKAIGLGLAFLRQTSEMCGGRFAVRSAPGQGTSVTASMRLSHIDRPPVGDLNATILALCAAERKTTVQLTYHSDGEKFHFDSRELATKGAVPL
ncbi:MAG TPA: ATP-binding protein [Candidatus Acidoferrum sp.]|nr:ATP-binding protein [Candidatus Acidoferrum sp.]